MNGWGFPSQGRITEVGLSGYLDDPTMGLELPTEDPLWGAGSGLVMPSPLDPMLDKTDPARKGASIAKRAIRQGDLDPISRDTREKVDAAENDVLYSKDTEGIPGLWIAAAAILAIFLIRKV